MRRFEFVGGGSNKFWEVRQSDTQVTVHFGRIGTNGQTQTKDYGSWDEAAERVRKLVAEKLREGYTETAREADDPGMAGFQRPPTLPRYEIPTLPGDGPLVIGEIELPAGRRLNGDPKWAPRGVEPVAQPVIWATDRPVSDSGRLLHQLRVGAAAMNLVPMLLRGMESDPTRPWDKGEFSPNDPRRVDSFDPAAELAHWWRGNFEDEDDETLPSVQPFGIKFPGVASPPPLTSRIVDDRTELEQIKGRRLALIAAGRPADAIAAIGWMGAVNVHDDTAPMSAVLRSLGSSLAGPRRGNRAGHAHADRGQPASRREDLARAGRRAHGLLSRQGLAGQRDDRGLRKGAPEQQDLGVLVGLETTVSSRISAAWTSD